MFSDRRVLLVEDDALLRGMLVEILQGQGFRVHAVGDAGSAMDYLDDDDPDALIVDLDLGMGASGLDVIDALGDRIREFGVLILSHHESPSSMGRGRQLPASVGYLVKHQVSHPTEVIAALEAVLTDAMPATRPEESDVPDALAALTPRQRELLRLISLGYSNEAIAEIRGVTVRSVETLISRLFAALDVASDPRGNARVRASMIYARAMGIPWQESL